LSRLEYLLVASAHVVPAHTHDFFEVFYCMRGIYSCRINGRPVEVRKGQVVIIAPGDIHEDTTETCVHLLVFQFFLYGTIGDLAVSRIFRKNVDPALMVINDTEKLSEAFLRHFRHEDSINDYVSAYLLDTLVLQFFWTCIRRLPSEVLSPKFLQIAESAEFTARVTRCFDENRRNALTVKKIADALCMSESALTQKCHKELGMPPLKAFMHYKMDRALSLIRHSSLPIKEVSDLLGFENQNHFSSVFKKYHHFSPTAARRDKPYPGLKPV
jgi:AraC-like DNA-binding protein